MNWFCTIESITATQIRCRTPAMSSAYKTGEAVKVVVSTRLLILSLCTGTCDFTYLPAASSPQLTAISSASVSLANGGTQAITLTGTNLIDSANFAEVALTHSITKVTTVYTATSATATQVVFSVGTTIASGNYQVTVRNAIGGSNAYELQIKWTPGAVSWSEGGSTEGGIVKVINGDNYPASIDGKIFAVTLAAGTVSYPLKVISCCTGNSI